MRHRLRSPLRWLSAVMSALLVTAFAGVLSPWLLLAVPVVGAVFLLAPPLGIYRHDETPPDRPGVRLEGYAVDGGGATPVNAVRFRLVLVNPGTADAEDFRVRLLVPHSLVPPGARVGPLGKLLVGELGTNWFVDSAGDATAITLRSARRDSQPRISCPAGSRTELAELILPALDRQAAFVLDYQVSGGSVQATLGRLRLAAGGSPTASGI
jgi:hypothetical protein